MYGSDLGDAGSGEGHNDGDHIDSELELQELGDAVVDVPAPHHSLHDAAEVIVCQDDVRRLLRHVRPCDALQKHAAEVTSQKPYHLLYVLMTIFSDLYTL